MKSKSWWIALVGLVVVGCSDSDDPAATGMAGMAGSAPSAGASGGGGMDTSGTGGAAGASAGGMGAGGDTTNAGGATSTAPTAPTLSEIMPMAGALHVSWVNQQDDCDTIEGERKTDSDDYKVVFTVPGEADNKHDTSATMNTLYTYRLRCKKGDVYSDYSGEMSRNPTQK